MTTGGPYGYGSSLETRTDEWEAAVIDDDKYERHSAWLRERPITFALLTALLMFVVGLAQFGDVRAALAGAVFGGGLIYLAWRPGGFGWKANEHQRRVLEERGHLGVRHEFTVRGRTFRRPGKRSQDSG